MRITVNKKSWQLVFQPLDAQTDGSCDAPDTPHKKIRISHKLGGQRQLETIIHELLHATAWEMLSEEFVEQVGCDLARILWKLGYRKVDQGTP